MNKPLKLVFHSGHAAPWEATLRFPPVALALRYWQLQNHRCLGYCKDISDLHSAGARRSCPKPGTLQQLSISLDSHSQQRGNAHFCPARLGTHHSAVAIKVFCPACPKTHPAPLTFCDFEKARSVRAKYYAAKLLPKSQFGALGEKITLSDGSHISLFAVRLDLLETRNAALTSPQVRHSKPEQRTEILN